MKLFKYNLELKSTVDGWQFSTQISINAESEAEGVKKIGEAIEFIANNLYVLKSLLDDNK